MNNYRGYTHFLLAICLAGVISCSEDEPGTPSPFSAADFTGTWVTACQVSGADSIIETLIIGGGMVTVQSDTYSGTNLCDNAPGTFSANFSFSIYGGQSLTWDGATPAGLSATVTGSTVHHDPTGFIKVSYFIDKSVTPNELYFGDSSLATDADGYPTQLYTKVFVKQ